MSGPWDDFKSSAPVEDGPWADFGGSSTQDKPLFRQEWVDSIMGLGETAVSAATGAVAMPLGFLAAGLSKMNDPANVDFEKTTAANMDAMTFHPRGVEGQEYTAKLGQVLNDVGIPAMAHIGMTRLPRMAEVGAGIGNKFRKGEIPEPIKTPEVNSAIADMDAAIKDMAPTPEVAPIKETRSGPDLSRQAYEQALREQELQKQSAFNRHENFPDMVKEAPMDRMVRDLGGEPNAPVAPDTPMTRMADDVTAERSTPAQRAAQDAIEARQTQMEYDVKRQTVPEMNAAERARQENAPTGYDNWKAKQDATAAEQASIAEAQRAEQIKLDQIKQQVDQLAADDVRRTEAQRYIDERQASLEKAVADQRHWDEQARVRAMDNNQAQLERMAQENPEYVRAQDNATLQEAKRAATEDAVGMGETNPVAAIAARNREKNAKLTFENIKKSPISSKGSIGRQRGALDLSDLRLGFGAHNKKLSKLTDILAQDTNWQFRMIQSLGGKEYLKNSDGSPKILLHGTIGEIKGKLGTRAQGFHAGTAAESHMFTNDAPPGSYVKTHIRADRTRENAQIHPVAIRDGNYPRINTDAGDWSPDRIVAAKDPSRSAYQVREHIKKALEDKGYTASEIDGFFSYVYNKTTEKGVNQAFTDILKRAGIDGFFYRNTAESPKSNKMFVLRPRTDVPKRIQTVMGASEHPYSFVTWDDNNFKSIFDIPEIPTPRTEKPIGQRGFANKQTGATSFFNFGAKENIQKNNSELFKAQKALESLSKAFWNERSISSEEFRPKQKALVDKIGELERMNRKWQETLPTQRKTEIHPGFEKIPLGTEVSTTRRGTLERATVIENKPIRYGDTVTWSPRVEFADGTKKRLTSADIEKVHRDPFKGPGKNQAGAIQLGWKKKEPLDALKKVAGIKENLKNFFPEDKPIPEVIKEHIVKGTPDVDQNFIQKGFNHLTKGSLYQAIKTNNPVVKVTGEVIRAADNQIKRLTGELVHDTLAPIAQRLSKKEKADIWAIQNVAEAKGFTLTPEFLQKHGYNDKQIDWVMTHQATMKEMYTKMSETMSAAGLKPVSERTAYLASRARGDFRKLIYKDVFNTETGKLERQVTGIVGDTTRMGLNKQVEQLKAKYPNYIIGEERYFGGRGKAGTAEGFSQMLEFLSENDPNLKEFVNRVNDMLTQDAYNYLNSKAHTMQKKRVFGMEGRKEFQSATKNAEEGMQAQIRYTETMIKWSEMSKAVEKLKPLLDKDNGLDMPVAKQWSHDYIQGALGQSPGAFGRALDDVIAAAGKSTGLGTSMGSAVFSGAKQAINGLLLGFWNTGFLAMNLIQPVRTMPEMAAFLKSKGVDVGVDIGLGRSIGTMMSELTGGKLNAVEQGALKYAQDNHVYSSNLFESGNTVSKNFGYYWNKGTQSIASGVEQQTRKLTFLAYVHMLSESGVKPKDGLYQAAHNATDVHMNNYAQAEAPRIFQETGPFGRTSYNLMSFKHNELSRMAMLAREMPKKNAAPFAMALASQVAFAGVMGVIGFKEADALYEKLSAMFGEPKSLTKMLIENPDLSDNLKFGMGNAAGVDLTSRMGIAMTPGSAIDALAPGASKLVNIGKAGVEAITNPSEYNTKNFVRETTPNSVSGIIDRAWFSGENAKGEELSMNRNKVQANAVRNSTDKLYKSLGLTGINESKQKTLDYANQKIDQVYKDKRKSVIDNAAKALFTSGKIPEDFAQNYVKYQGDPNMLERELQTMAIEQKVDQHTLQLMKNAMSTSLTSMHKLMRMQGRE